MIKQDLIGNRYGKLVVIKEVSKRGDVKDSVYECLCDCGNSKSISARHLRSGGTKSCGCLAQENRSFTGKLHRINDRNSVLLKGLFAKFKNEIRKKKVKTTIELTFEQFCGLVTDNCFYCGSLPQNEFTYTYSGEKLKYSGIDRIDSNNGYAISNVVSCCWRCNSAKNNMSLIDFANWLRNIMNIFGKSENFVELTKEMKQNV